MKSVWGSMSLPISVWMRPPGQWAGGEEQARTVTDAVRHTGTCQGLSRADSETKPDLSAQGMTFRQLGPIKEGSFLCHKFLQETAKADGGAARGRQAGFNREQYHLMASTVLPARPEQRNPVQMEPPALQLLEVWAQCARSAAAPQSWVFMGGPGRMVTVGGSAGC